ncbi:MAG: biotin carboxylase N-terminal domain-containing protein [Flaviflexus sp.]|nr:biotin carboxylase N-terminal domain-containing protein [Flaviflexus sp.]
MISTLLVANRGEIAARIIRTARDLGIRSVAVYAAQDVDSPAVRLADEAYALPGSSIAETYLNADAIIDIARRAGADAIHPGYGFLSEIPSFARAVVDAGLIWVGPRAETIEALGDKIGARRTAVAAGVDPVPGTNDPVSDMALVRAFAAEHGFPIVLKRSDGGGGHGIVIIRSRADIDEFAARHDMPGGDLGAYFIERFIESARHIETQCMADSHGNFAVVTTRDCSVQRRNQKLIEEAPAPFLPEGVEDTVAAWSKALFSHTGYVGLGTCEFLLDEDGSVYFLEVNPRLQVEHTVSEEVTGLDLVEEQLRIASGEALAEVPAARGHSIELRITCEDPGADLAPTAGVITDLFWPSGPGVRLDTGVGPGNRISPDFDSMIAKLIITGPTRPRAIARALRALGELHIEGIATPAPLLAKILHDPDFAEDFKVGTRWLETQVLPGTDFAPFEAAEQVAQERPSRTFTAEIDGRRHTITVPADLFGSVSSARPVQPRRSSGRKESAAPGADGVVVRDGVLVSPMQAIVVRIAVEEGQQVAEGDILLVLESMKMEKYVHASSAGTIAEIMVDPGQNVPANTPLMKINMTNDVTNDVTNEEDR